jgi:hypothetical protein
MTKKNSRSFNERDPDEIKQTYRILVGSINTWFQTKKYLSDEYFLFKTGIEIEQMKNIQLNEVERYTSFDIIASIEAMFVIDYYRRCEKKLKDDLSRDFRVMHKKVEKKGRVEFKKHILDIWIKYNPHNELLKELNTIFKYRHWIAHGRYWLLKINSSKYDFQYLYMICSQIKDNFGLQK